MNYINPCAIFESPVPPGSIKSAGQRQNPHPSWGLLGMLVNSVCPR